MLAASPSGDDWALRANLQLCGAVSPPTYADLRTAAHLQTFDQEAAEVEQVKLNASGSQALLLAKNWVKVLRLPVENKRRPQSVAQRRGESDESTRFLVKFEDGSEQEVTLKENELVNEDDVEEIVKRHSRAAQGKRVAFVSREHCVASVRAVGYFSKVRHAAWHPLSDAHIVVLSDAEEITVFNTQQDVSKPEQRHMLDFPAKAPLLIECLNLGIDDSSGKAVLERDATDSRLVYCLHSTGVHVINVSWVSALAMGKQFTTLPKSSVRHVFSVSPNSTGSPNRTDAVVPNVVGARVVKNVNFGHLLLLRLASGSFEIVNVSAASSELLKGVLVDSSSIAVSTSGAHPQKTLPGTLASMASSKSRAAVSAPANASSNSTDGGIQAFGDIVEEKLEALSARGTRITGNTLMHEVDDAVLAFVLERVKILYEDVEYIDEMDQLMRDRLQLHSTMIKVQTEKAVVVQKSAADARASLKALQDKMERALAVQQNLSKRAAAVLQAVKENQPHLSRTERDFKGDLEQMAVGVRRMKPRVSELTVLGQRAVRLLESAALSAASSSRYWNSLGAGGSSALSTEKKKMCFDVLRAETQLIDDTKVMLEDLNTNLQQLNE
ncbi:hypothetical protein BBO99_00009453 [Phytophthora kernoviae]|uniref:Uncharacterized protein n=2 Tax=Phytophthora kernoviae TaxID=325452 RepID=A0A3R7JUJ0_9STRA|nr:hypothetical protein G195_011295 [Phytophthora kernoviae 00238/432]KAG2503036.1 hypothetical protein JM16_009470 [Phytophthora kernoviae]KAG2505176.1 hypothetical protein JM18_009509 [Phytophthora kernoviae]RLN45038.1 hypothetical protein BBI17_009473 [Phytophthora kernoviae]RLN73357.1 hypothetical protein BBO99_00009453 [Phytophthora kernoviae]